VSSNASDVPGERPRQAQTEAAGEPAKRPDIALPEQVYKDERPPEYFARYHERTREREPDWIYELVRGVMLPVILLGFRGRAYGSENVPNGSVILAPNHGSFMDHFICGSFVRRHVQFMGKSQMFIHGSPKTFIYTHGGVFPVRRGGRDEDVFITANAILARGGCLGMYVEGGRTRTGELSQEAKPGLGRLALETGASVVPVAIVGSHQIRNWKRGHLPQVSVYYGKPLAFTKVEAPSRGQQQAAANEVLRRITALYDEKKSRRGRPD
jgi:1-acyl-sn-glycerol-3-phosphate acyltransferase